MNMMILQLGLSALAMWSRGAAAVSSESMNIEVGHSGVEVKPHAAAGSLLRSEAMQQRQPEDGDADTTMTSTSTTTPVPVWRSCPIACLGCSNVGTGATNGAQIAAAREGMRKWIEEQEEATKAFLAMEPWESVMESRCNSECQGTTDADRTHCLWDNSTSPGTCTIAFGANASCPPMSTTTTTPEPHAWFNEKFQRMKKRMP